MKGPRFLADEVWVAACLLVTLALSTVGCTRLPDGGASTVAAPGATGAPSATAAQAPLDRACGSYRWSVEYAPYSVETLAQNGVFVLGHMTAVEAAVFNTSDGAVPIGFPRPALDAVASPQPNGKVLTPVTLSVDRVLQGEIGSGGIRAFVEGGTVGCITVEIAGAPKIDQKAQYVFVLGAAFDADGKRMPDVWSLPFAWPVDDADVVQTVDGPMTLDDLTRLLAAPKASVVP